MKPSNQLRFAVNDRINDVDVSPSLVPLALLGEFQKDVSEFVNTQGEENLYFDVHQPRFDEDEFNVMVERGTKAWADVPDATVWVETLRGN
ncbi:MAG: hypothetical protein ABSB19_15935 [Methylomonas sp.]|jgi:hypothetical protein